LTPEEPVRRRERLARLRRRLVINGLAARAGLGAMLRALRAGSDALSETIKDE